MEFLKTFLSEETFNKLAQELEGKEVKLADLSKGDYVSSAKYQNLVGEVETLKGQISQRDADIEQLKKTSSLSTEQEQKLTQLQEQYEKDKQEWEHKLVEMTKNSALELVITKSGTKDPVALKAHISKFIEEAEFKDGQFVGLDEHIATRKGSDLVHLFGQFQKTGDDFKAPPKPEPTRADIIKEKIYGGK